MPITFLAVEPLIRLQSKLPPEKSTQSTARPGPIRLTQAIKTTSFHRLSPGWTVIALRRRGLLYLPCGSRLTEHPLGTAEIPRIPLDNEQSPARDGQDCWQRRIPGFGAVSKRLFHFQLWSHSYRLELRSGLIRQFVAMPLGAGYTAEEQITGEAEHGGLQIIVYPMKAAEFEKRFPLRRRSRIIAGSEYDLSEVCFAEMGLAPGGMMEQDISDDPYGHDVWEHNVSSRCFVHLANSMIWKSITGKNPPHPPMTAKQYSKFGMPWFEFYSEQPAIEGSAKLDQLKSVKELGKLKGDKPLPENQSATPVNIQVVSNKLTKHQVREGKF